MRSGWRQALAAAALCALAGSIVDAQFNLATQSQLYSDQCDFAAFQSRSAAVDRACCQGKSEDICAGGTPTRCDLECAVTYLPFFEECQNMIMSLAGTPTPTVIHVGSSGENTKSVPASGLSDCGSEAVNDQNPNWRDTFSVRLNSGKGGGQTIAVTRTDSSGGWGQDLEISCTANGAMAGLTQLENSCEGIPAREAVDAIVDLMGHCDMVAMDCDANGCRGGPPLQCATAGDGSAAADGETTLAEVITAGEEVSYQGLCLGSVDGGGWTYVTEAGRSTTDTSDVFIERPTGYHSFVYDLKGMRVNQVLVKRTSSSWCDSWEHSDVRSFWGVSDLTTASMGIALGTEELCCE